MVKEKKHRLNREFYQGEITVSITSCVNERLSLFVNDDIFKTFENILLTELQKQNFEAQIYLFMPDHLHIIVSGRDSNCNTLDLFKMYKQRTGFWLYKNLPEYSWQKDYYDHIIRDENDIMNQIYYILENPVRKGLSNTWKNYPYKGSTVYNLNEIER